jgi:hypothetical protein
VIVMTYSSPSARPRCPARRPAGTRRLALGVGHDVDSEQSRAPFLAGPDEHRFGLGGARRAGVGSTQRAKGESHGQDLRREIDGYQTLIEWSPSDPELVEAAEEVFYHEVKHGYVAVVHDDNAHSNEPVRRLPVNADLVVMTIPM